MPWLVLGGSLPCQTLPLPVPEAEGLGGTCPMLAVHCCATVVVLPSGNASSVLSGALEGRAEDGYCCKSLQR